MDMDIKEKSALGIFIFSMAMIFILVFFMVSQNKITGNIVGNAVIENENKGVYNQEVSCSDSDGIDYGVKGSVNYCTGSDCSSKDDSCSGKELTEWHCKDNEAISDEYECKDDCYDGACINLVTKYKENYKFIGGGGGGSASGSSTTSAAPAEPVANTYEIGELGETSQELAKNEKISFQIYGVNYLLTLTDFTETSAMISIYGVGLFSIGLGNEKSIDLNNDGTSEMFLKIKSINIPNNKVTLMIGRY